MEQSVRLIEIMESLWFKKKRGFTVEIRKMAVKGNGCRRGASVLLRVGVVFRRTLVLLFSRGLCEHTLAQ